VLLKYLEKVNRFLTCNTSIGNFSRTSEFQTTQSFVSGAASPRNIEILMNVEGVNRKHIASHLQVYIYLYAYRLIASIYIKESNLLYS
jgi:SHAQKYF class myb-like DNA-binding protein